MEAQKFVMSSFPIYLPSSRMSFMGPLITTTSIAVMQPDPFQVPFNIPNRDLITMFWSDENSRRDSNDIKVLIEGVSNAGERIKACIACVCTICGRRGHNQITCPILNVRIAFLGNVVYSESGFQGHDIVCPSHFYTQNTDGSNFHNNNTRGRGNVAGPRNVRTTNRSSRGNFRGNTRGRFSGNIHGSGRSNARGSASANSSNAIVPSPNSHAKKCNILTTEVGYYTYQGTGTQPRSLLVPLNYDRNTPTIYPSNQSAIEGGASNIHGNNGGNIYNQQAGTNANNDVNIITNPNDYYSGNVSSNYRGDYYMSYAGY